MRSYGAADAANHIYLNIPVLIKNLNFPEMRIMKKQFRQPREFNMPAKPTQQFLTPHLQKEVYK